MQACNYNSPTASDADQSMAGKEEAKKKSMLAQIDLERMLAEFEKSVVDERAKAFEAFRNENKPSNDELAAVQIKPYFKEWLEIKYDANNGRGETGKLVEKESNALLERCDALTKCLKQLNLHDYSKRMKDFVAWLEEQVTAVRKFIVKITQKEDDSKGDKSKGNQATNQKHKAMTRTKPADTSSVKKK